MSKREQRARARWEWIKRAVGDRCVACRSGRILLHVLCAAVDREFRWHVDGVRREFAAAMTPVLRWR